MLVVTLYFWFMGRDLLAAIMALIETSIQTISQPFAGGMQTLMNEMIEIANTFLGP